MNFHHPFSCDFVKTSQPAGDSCAAVSRHAERTDAQSFDAYQPEARVLKEYPVDEVEFRSGAPTSIYNWELFFHIPLLIADRLSSEPAFRGGPALVPLHLRSDGSVRRSCSQRYWRTKPFHDRLKATTKRSR